VTDESYTESWRVALARVEGKIDTMVELATRMQVAVNDLDRRVRDVETSMARVKQQLSEIERHEAPRTNWVGVMSSVVAAIAVALVVAERLFAH